MEIKAQIRHYLARNLLYSDNGFGYGDDASFLEEGIVDSLGIIDLVSFIEEAFGVTVADEDITPANFDSVNKLANFVESRLQMPV